MRLVGRSEEHELVGPSGGPVVDAVVIEPRAGIPRLPARIIPPGPDLVAELDDHAPGRRPDGVDGVDDVARAVRLDLLPAEARDPGQMPELRPLDLAPPPGLSERPQPLLQVRDGRPEGLPGDILERLDAPSSPRRPLSSKYPPSGWLRTWSTMTWLAGRGIRSIVARLLVVPGQPVELVPELPEDRRGDERRPRLEVPGPELLETLSFRPPWPPRLEGRPRRRGRTALARTSSDVRLHPDHVLRRDVARRREDLVDPGPALERRVVPAEVIRIAGARGHLVGRADEPSLRVLDVGDVTARHPAPPVVRRIGPVEDEAPLALPAEGEFPVVPEGDRSRPGRRRRCSGPGNPSLSSASTKSA